MTSSRFQLLARTAVLGGVLVVSAPAVSMASTLLSSSPTAAAVRTVCTEYGRTCVQSGETWSAVAKRVGVTTTQLLASNGKTSTNNGLVACQVLSYDPAQAVNPQAVPTFAACIGAAATAATTTTLAPTTTQAPTTTAAPTTTISPTTTAAPSTVFVATATNTGVPAGTTLVDSGAVTFTAADNGRVITGVRFTGRVTFSGVSNLTIRNSAFMASDYFLIIGSGTNVLLDQDTIDGGNWTQDNFGFQTSGVTYRHLRAMRLGNIGRAMSNTLVDGLYADQPTTTVDGAHVDGIEISGDPSGVAVSNVTIKDAVIAYPKGFTWGPSTNQGGLTSAINITSDFGPISGVTIQHVQETGGAFTQYVRETGGYLVRNVVFDDVVIDNSLYGPISISESASIAGWTNVRDLTGAAIAHP